MKNIVLPLLLLLSYSVTAQTTNIPDPGFEEWLIDHNIDSDGTINGHLLTSDAEAVTELIVNGSEGASFISDLTGLEDFVNLESFTITQSMITELDVSQNIKLKTLDCTNNWLTSLDLSSNPLLEYLDIKGGGDVGFSNAIQSLDLGANPNIHTVIATDSYYLEKINLRNGNNSPEMHLEIGFFIFDNPAIGPNDILGNVCIEIDNEEAAQGGQLPYSGWEIDHPHATYQLLEDCALGLKETKNNSLLLYPNPATDIVTVLNSTPVEEITIYDSTGRIVLQNKCNDNEVPVDISALQAGSYIIKVTTATGTATQKLVAN